MPVIVKGTADRHGIGEIGAEHPGWGPNIHHMGIDRITPIREPHRRKMDPLLVGAVNVFGKLKPGCSSAGESVQQAPVGRIVKFREVGNRRLAVGVVGHGRRCADRGF